MQNLYQIFYLEILSEFDTILQLFFRFLEFSLHLFIFFSKYLNQIGNFILIYANFHKIFLITSSNFF